MSTVLTNNYLFSANIDETEEQIKTAIYQEFISDAKNFKELDDLLNLVKSLEIVEDQKFEVKFKDRVYVLLVVRDSDQPKQFRTFVPSSI